MTHNPHKFDWDDLRYPLTVARRGSTLAAGRALAIDQSTVQRRLVELERRIGESLVQRQPSGYRLTGFGQEMLPFAEAVERSVLAFERQLQTLGGETIGVIRMTCPEPIVYRITQSGLLDRFHARHPALRVPFVMSDKYLDLNQGDADVALRSGKVGEALRTATKLATTALRDKPSVTVSTTATTASAPRAHRIRISSVARALAEELGVDTGNIEGSGDDGMITRDDVRAHAASATSGKVQIRPRSPMRRAIADATSHAWQTIPHVALQSHADVTKLIEGNEAGLTAAIARACALSLGEHPSFNGWLIEQGFKPSAQADIGFAISTPDGLVTAVVTAAQTKSMMQLGQELRDMAETARAARLDGAKMTGASFTISSLGRWGVDAFSQILSAPQVAILGVGRVARVAREAPDGGVRFASKLGLTLVFDHRANDGVAAAQLLAAIAGYLEQPAGLESAP